MNWSYNDTKTWGNGKYTTWNSHLKNYRNGSGTASDYFNIKFSARDIKRLYPKSGTYHPLTLYGRGISGQIVSEAIEVTVKGGFKNWESYQWCNINKIIRFRADAFPDVIPDHAFTLGFERNGSSTAPNVIIPENVQEIQEEAFRGGSGQWIKFSSKEPPLFGHLALGSSGNFVVPTGCSESYAKAITDCGSTYTNIVEA